MLTPLSLPRSGHLLWLRDSSQRLAEEAEGDSAKHSYCKHPRCGFCCLMCDVELSTYREVKTDTGHILLFYSALGLSGIDLKYYSCSDAAFFNAKLSVLSKVCVVPKNTYTVTSSYLMIFYPLWLDQSFKTEGMDAAVYCQKVDNDRSFVF